MADIATVWNVGQGFGDWQISPAELSVWVDQNGNSIRDQSGAPVGVDFTPGQGLVSGADLYTAALNSLFTDAAAGPDDIIPDGSTDPRGWWGDPDIGSKLWLLARSKATPDIPGRAKGYSAGALQWLIDDDVVARIDIVTQWTKPNMLGAQITFYRRDGVRAALSFGRLWETV
jgi:phage gp46-like protein